MAEEKKQKLVDRITITQPNDMHLHLRDGDMLATVAPMSAAWAGRAIIMPNLQPPVTTTDMAVAYRERILAAVPEKQRKTFEPMMTLYLTDNTPPEEIHKAKATGVIKACKLYPAGATTNSAAGVTDLMKLVPTFKAMEETGLVLCIHGEVVDPAVDFFDREATFMATKLGDVLDQVANLKVVIEHATTKETVEFVRLREHPGGLGCTITPQHLLFNRNALFIKGLNPHFFCLPILKKEPHRLALVAAATSGDPRFFAGTDSAPHVESSKLSCCGCAGCFTAPYAPELYAMAFDSVGALDKLEGFLSKNGPAFYGFPEPAGSFELVRVPQTIAKAMAAGDELVVPLLAGEIIPWSRSS